MSYESLKSETFWIVSGCSAVIATCTYFLLQPAPIEYVQSQSPAIGFVRPSGPDVRVRPDRELSWANLSKDRDVQNNDRIFAGPNSRAVVRLKDSSSFTVEPNSLLKVSNESDRVELNLEQGSLLSTMKGSSRVEIKNKDQTVELTSSGATIRVAARSSGFQLVVLDGQTKIKGSKRTVSANQEILIDKNSEIRARDLEFKLISPPPGAQVWTIESLVHFQWSTRGQLSEVALEISEDPNFSSLVSRTVLSEPLADIKLNSNRNYYWRVRAPNGQATSPISPFSVYRLEPPILPPHNSIGVTTDWRGRVLSEIRFAWIDPSYSDKYKFEIARQSDFSKIDYTVETEAQEVRLRGLKTGTYYWRVTSRQATREDLQSSASELELIDGKLELPPSELRTPTSIPPSPPSSKPTPPPIPIAKPEVPLPVVTPSPIVSPQLSREIYRFELTKRGLHNDNPPPHVVSTEAPQIEWSPVADVARYKVELSSRPDFKDSKSWSTLENQWTWPEARPGNYFARVIAVIKGPNGMEREVRGSAAQLSVWLAPPKITGWNEEKLNLKWKAHPLAKQAEIQVSEDRDFIKREVFRTNGNGFSFPKSGPGRKYIRMRSLDRLGWTVSRYSASQTIEVKAPTPPPTPTRPLVKSEKPQPERKLAQSAPISKTEIPAAPLRYPPPFYSLSIGVGASYLSFAQSSNSELGTTSFAKMISPTYSIGGTFRMAPKYVLALEYQDRKTQTTADPNALVLNNDFEWRRISAELQYHAREFSKWYLTGLGGLQVHDLPFYSSNGNQTASLFQNRLFNVSLGARALYLWREKYEFEGLLRFQSTLSSKSLNGDSLTVRSGIMFDGSLGVARRLSREIKLGLYWFGQNNQFSYSYQRSGSQSSGEQNFFDSSVQFRLFYERDKSTD